MYTNSFFKNAINYNILERAVLRMKDINVKKVCEQTALHIAVANGDIDTVKLLMEKEDTNIEARDEYGKTPFYYACLYQQKEISKILISKGAKIDIKEDIEKNFIMKILGYEKFYILNSLRGYYLNQELLLHAIKPDNDKLKNLFIYALLISKGADIKIADEWGQTILHHNIYNNNEEIVKYLILKGANINAKNCLQKTPLHVAIERKNTNIAKLLIEKEPDIEAKDYRGRTPFYYAKMNNNIEIIDFIKETYSKLNREGDLKTDNKTTPNNNSFEHMLNNRDSQRNTNDGNGLY